MLPHILVSLVDGILMRTGESGECQFSSIGPALRDDHAGQGLIDFADVVDVGEIEMRIDSLGIQVQGDGDDVQIAGALTVPEEGSLNPLRAGQHGQLGAGDAGSAVIVRMNGDDGGFGIGQLADKVLNLVGKRVAGVELHRVGQVQDYRIFLRRPQGFHDPGTDFNGKIRFSAGEGLGGVLEAVIGIRLIRLGQFPDQLCTGNGDVDDAVHVFLENHAALELRGGIVEMNDDILCAVNRFKGLADEMLTCLNQHLNGDIVRNQIVVNQGTEEFIFRFRGGREADFDFLEPDLNRQLEEFNFLGDVHGGDEGLVAVTQIHRAPYRRLCDMVVGPGTVGKGDRYERLILFKSLFH